MALDQSALLDLIELRSADGATLMNQLLATVLQTLVEAEATAWVGAERHERTETRVTQRNGYRGKTVATATGDVTVRIPKTRTGSFFPSLLAPRRRIDQALYAVIAEAYVHGVSTRKVDDLMAALGADTGISKSEVSRICGRLDTELAAFASRPLAAFPYVFADATYCKVRRDGRVVSQAIIIATGVGVDGHREVLGHAVGDSEDETFGTEFFRGLRERGLTGVQLVICDSHRGLVNAITKVFPGSAWQRCRVLSCATCSPRSARATARWSLPASARSSLNPAPARFARRSTRSPGCSPAGSPRRGHARRREDRHHRVRRLPRRPLEEAVVDEPAGTVEQEVKPAPT